MSARLLYLDPEKARKLGFSFSEGDLNQGKLGLSEFLNLLFVLESASYLAILAFLWKLISSQTKWASRFTLSSKLGT